MDFTLWHDILHVGLPIGEKILRPILVYFFLILAFRLAGKRELAQLNAFDLVVLLMISNTVQNAIIGEDNSVTGGLIGATTLLLLNYGVVRFTYGHEKLDRLVEGSATVLIANGRVQSSKLKEELITVAELETAARQQGFSTLEDVESATLEPSGRITITGKKPTAESSRHQELMSRLEEIQNQLAELRGTATS